MKVAYLLPGSGGSFYCGNCTRDSFMSHSLRQSGFDVLMIPMYLPLSVDNCETDSPIFYGAVNIYLEQISAVFKYLPSSLKKLLDSDKILRFAARQAGSTNASGNELMTISMLKGEHGKQAHDLEVLIQWLREHEKPDVVHLSNALLTGLAPRLKTELGCKVICTLQDEDEWVDAMREPFSSQTWKLIEENAHFVDHFIAVSTYYAGLIQSKINIAASKISVIHNSIGSEIIRKNKHRETSPTIGYMSKINSEFGADVLFDIFCKLKEIPEFNNLKLLYSGGYTDDYKSVLKYIKKKSSELGIAGDIRFSNDLSFNGKKEFFESISLLCVPSRRKEAFGMYILEAFAAEVPVVMPHIGAYPEIIQKSNAGITYEPENPENLLLALKDVLGNPDKYNQLKQNCHPAIAQYFNTKNQSEKIGRIYT
jgi:glycosyltransferase involved in cell wall biosynthesis